MDIVLEYLDPERWPRPAGWTVVGRVGSQALAYDAERRPHILGDGEPAALDREAVNAALAPAVDAAASKLWPGGWTFAMAEVFDINRRSLSADRLARQGLPPGVLESLAYASEGEDAEVIGALMLALARYADRHADGPNPSERIDQALRAAQNAGAALRLARKGKPIRQDQDTTP